MRSDRTKHRKESIHRTDGERFQTTLQQPQTIIQQQKVFEQHHPIDLRLEAKGNPTFDAYTTLVDHQTCKVLLEFIQKLSTLLRRETSNYGIPIQKRTFKQKI